jgi:hypothetical protein
MILTPQVIPEVIPDVRCFHMFVVGMMLCTRAASSQTPPVSDRALAQGSMGALADAGRIDASQLSQTFSSLPDKGSWRAEGGCGFVLMAQRLSPLSRAGRYWRITFARDPMGTHASAQRFEGAIGTTTEGIVLELRGLCRH